MIGIPFRAVAAQTPWRFVMKVVVSMFLVAIAVVIHKEGLALALLVIFSGVTGPAIRIVTLRMSGMLDRIMVSPAYRPFLVLTYTGIWSIAVFAALVPASLIVLYLQGSALLLPLITGTVLAVSVGTLAGLAAKTLGDAHLYAILAAAPLVVSSLVPGPQSLVLPYSTISMNIFSPFSTVTQIGFLIVWLLVLVAVASRM